jgi:AraC-like DNA-binding protein
MPLLERMRTDQVVIGSFVHEPCEPAAAIEWWERCCVAFTASGSWQVRSRRGGGEVTPATVLVGEAGAEYDCRHPDGMDDRMLCVIYRRDVDPGPAVLVPQAPALRQTGRSLAAELRSAEPAPDEVEALCLAMLELCREAPGRPRRPGHRSRSLVARLQAEASTRYTDMDFDLVAEAAGLGMSRTRLIHTFREVAGLTPHRYLLELRTSHAARLLAQTRAPVTEICFASGFGSMNRFHAAFYDAFGITPTAYRIRYGRAG